MKIQIKQWSGKNRELLIRQTIKHVASLIFSDQALAIIKTINIKMIKSPQVTVCSKQSPADGYLGYHYNTQEGVVSICIKSTLNDTDFIGVLAHELMHLAQFADQRLLMGSEDAFWKINGRYCRYNIQSESYQEYLDWPWEKEARDFANAYLKILNHSKRNEQAKAAKRKESK